MIEYSPLQGDSRIPASHDSEIREKRQTHDKLNSVSRIYLVIVS